MNRYAIFLLLAVMVGASGCASMFVNTVKTITIESDPPAAVVSDKSGNKLGTTPYSFTPSKDEKYSFVVSMRGFEDYEMAVKPVVREGALWADAMLLCIPCIVDIPSKAYMEFPKSHYKVDMERSPTKANTTETSMFTDQSVYVNILEPKIKFKDGQVIGKINSSAKKYNSDKPDETTGSSVLFTDAVCGEFNKFNILSVKCGINHYERQTNNLLPAEKQPVIEASVEGWNVDLKYASKKYVGSGNIDVTWKVLDPSQNNKAVLEKRISCSADLDERQLKYAFMKLITKSAEKFIIEDSLFDFISEHNQLTPELMKGEVVEMKKPKNPAFPQFKDLVGYCMKAVVTVKLKEGFGSGVIISPSGFILTNYHVVEESKEVKVKLNTGITLVAKVIKTNSAADLALLKVDAQDLPSLPFSMSDAEVGEEVIAIGTPGDIALEQTVSKGIISGKRKIEGKNFLQTDVSINPGNSGGPLLNEKGEIAGIITMKIVGKGMEGLGFAFPSQDVINLLNIKLN